MHNKTNISESQIAAFILNFLVVVSPFFDSTMTTTQTQSLSALLAAIAVFAWNQRRKDKAVNNDK